MIVGFLTEWIIYCNITDTWLKYDGEYSSLDSYDEVVEWLAARSYKPDGKGLFNDNLVGYIGMCEIRSVC